MVLFQIYKFSLLHTHNTSLNVTVANTNIKFFDGCGLKEKITIWKIIFMLEQSWPFFTTSENQFCDKLNKI